MAPLVGCVDVEHAHARCCVIVSDSTDMTQHGPALEIHPHSLARNSEISHGPLVWALSFLKELRTKGRAVLKVVFMIQRTSLNETLRVQSTQIWGI